MLRRTTLPKVKYLADVNVLVALTDEGHIHHKMVRKWFDASGYRDWGVCAFSEAGFLRVMTNPKLGSLSVEEATRVLAALGKHAGHRIWPISEGWASLASPFRERVFGHQQITDAYLLGLAVKENGVLVTMDKAIRSLAGAEYGKNVLVLE
jgi:toxin-antitoxin system PIN domain toxin